MSEGEKPWMGHVQRSRLGGFSRLRAILWKRSLRLYEAWTLSHLSWVKSLRKELEAGFAGVDPHRRDRLGSSADIFGETPVVTVVKLLDMVSTLRPDHPDRFLDLGCGRGITCLAAAHCGYRPTGYEQESDWCRRAAEVARSLGVEADVVPGDLFRHQWPQPALVFVVATAYDAGMRERLVERFRDMEGSLFIIGDWSLPEGFEELWSGSLPVDWGAIPFTIYCGG